MMGEVLNLWGSFGVHILNLAHTHMPSMPLAKVKPSLQGVLAMRQSQALDSRIRTTAEITLSIA